MTANNPIYCEIDFPRPSSNNRLTGAFKQPEWVLIAHELHEVAELLGKVDEFAQAGYWAIGFVAYEAAAAFDSALHTHHQPPADLPFAMFAIFSDRTPPPRQRGEYLTGVWLDETPRERFDDSVTQIKQGIYSGNYYQVNYTTQLQTSFSGEGLSFFDRLKKTQPDAYCAYLDFGKWQICSVSPELFFHFEPASDTEPMLTCRPMKGTARRHVEPLLDRKEAQKLLHSPKERAENLMIVDLVRNDLSRVATPGTVKVPQLFSVEAWPTVWQMTSTVTCRTAPSKRLPEIFRALFPCGSITGAPKAASMSAISALELSPRGIYCGAIGIVMPGGEALFSVGIRTPVINVEQGISVCGIGSGITLDSNADNEYAEWLTKQTFLRQSCPDYELLETLRLHQGRYWLLNGHLARLKRSAAALGFPFDTIAILKSLLSAALHHKEGQWRVRLCLSQHGNVNIETLPLEQHPQPLNIVMAKTAITRSNPWLRHKTTRRDMYPALPHAREEIFDVLLFNELGEVTEFTRGNLVIEREGLLITPALSCGVLPGIFREKLLHRKRIKESIIHVDDLAQAKMIWFINSVRGAIAVNPNTTR